MGNCMIDLAQNGNFSRVIQVFKKFENFAGLYFRILQHFATKLCHSTNFKTLFLPAVKDFVLSALFDLQSMQIVH